MVNLLQTLRPDDQGLRGIILSVTSLRRALFPEVTSRYIVEKSDETPPLSFVLRQIHILRNYLKMPPIHLEDDIKSLEGYVDEIYFMALKHNYQLKVIGDDSPVPHGQSSLAAILASFEQLDADLHVDWHKVSAIDFSINAGIRLGAVRWYAYPSFAGQHMLEIGTAIARRQYRLAEYEPESHQAPPRAKFDTEADHNMEGHYLDVRVEQAEP
ncbi:hypothetical protein FNYG_12760 [Fusarium nygamai]|uniref:Uncharacterized protein n=1 Tax=Gibberella nygamai TaxID=42673 RepID=A0A2K0VV48_GIBNY|nr:hypothetical protein FNYG_12760 [Fusarium nygamai]